MFKTRFQEVVHQNLALMMISFILGHAVQIQMMSAITIQGVSHLMGRVSLQDFSLDETKKLKKFRRKLGP